MSGIKKARKTAASLKKDIKAKEAKAKKKAESALVAVQKDPELMRMYKDNAQVGASNLVGELPLLKVFAVGRSQGELANGSQPKDGWFFYRPTQEQFKEVECHILTISRGFRAEGMQGKKDVFNQVMAGAIVNNGDIRPFITYFTGLKLQPMWDFAQVAAKWTKAKPTPIPMFALSVKLTTKEVKHNYGKSWVIDFKIMKNKDGSPVVVTDPGLFQFLRDHVEQVEDTIASLISTKSTEEAVDQPPHPAEPEVVRNAEEVFKQKAEAVLDKGTVH